MRRAPEWKGRRPDLAFALAQQGDKGVFQGRRRDADLPNLDAGLAQRLARELLSHNAVLHHNVEVVSEPLRIVYPRGFMQDVLGAAEFRRPHHQALETETVAKRARRTGLMNPAFVHQRDARATLRLVEIR